LNKKDFNFHVFQRVITKVW